MPPPSQTGYPGSSATAARRLNSSFRRRLEQKIDQIIGLLRSERYRFSPARRVYILTAYGNIYPNQGAMTPGPDQETADGMRRKTLVVCADCHAWIRSAPVTHAA